MRMMTRNLGPVQAARFRAIIKARIRFSDCYGVQYGHGMALFEPINDAPCVFVAPDVLHVFEPTSGSGTDFMRARVQAERYYWQLEELQQASASQ